MSTGLNWFQARALANPSDTTAGEKIRRADWEYWLYFDLNSFLWWINGSGPDRIVLAADFAAMEFLANDWTDEAWGTTVVVGGGTGTGTGGTGTGGTGTGTGGTGSTTRPPSNGGGAGGGGGGGSFSAPGGGPPSNKSPAGTIAMTVTLESPDAPVCYLPGDPQFNLGTTGTINLVATVNIPTGPRGVYLLSIVCAGQTQVTTAFAGMSQQFRFNGIFFTPGTSTFTATATADIGAITTTASGSYTTMDWCEIDESFVVSLAFYRAYCAYSPVVVSSKTFTNPYNKPTHVVLTGDADDDILVSTTGIYMFGGSSATDRGYPGPGLPNQGTDTAHPLAGPGSGYTFLLPASATFTLTLYDTVGDNAGCNINVHFNRPNH